MKKLHVWSLLLITFCFVHTGYAQEIDELSCDEKAEFIIQREPYFDIYVENSYELELIDELLEYIAPCVDSSNPKAMYAKGLLHLVKGDYRYHEVLGYIELSYQWINLAAFYGYGPAQLRNALNFYHGTYESKGVNYGLAKSDLYDMLENNYKPDIANYLLGYFSLKKLNGEGIYTSEQQLTNAKNYFESSNHPMAKHWLAIMHYFGYGVPKNETLALQMLADNAILNSQTLLQHLQNQNNDWIPISAEERTAYLEGFDSFEKATATDLDGKTFSGHFTEFDWPAKGVKRYIPVTISLEITGSHGFYTFLDYEFTMNGITTSGEARIYDNILGFVDGLTLAPLPNLLKDHPDKNTLTYHITGLSFNKGLVDNNFALLAKVHEYGNIARIEELDEYIKTPLRMILYPETPPAALAANTSLSENQIKTSTTLKKEAAVIAPNPIGDQFTITYTSDQEASIQVSVYDFFGRQRLSLPVQHYKAEGTHTITIDSAALPSGTYLVQLTINGAPYTKTVIKE